MTDVRKQNAMELLDKRIAEVVREINHSSEYTFNKKIGTQAFHIAFSVMGDVKRINVAADTRRRAVKNDESELIIGKLWDALDPERKPTALQDIQ